MIKTKQVFVLGSKPSPLSTAFFEVLVLYGVRFRTKDKTGKYVTRVMRRKRTVFCEGKPPIHTWIEADLIQFPREELAEPYEYTVNEAIKDLVTHNQERRFA